MKIFRIVFWLSLILIGGVVIGYSVSRRTAADQVFATEVHRAQVEAQRIQSDVVLFSKGIVPTRVSFAGLLQSLGISSDAVARVTATVKPVFDLRHVRAGNQVSVGRSVLGELREIRYRIDPDRMLSIAPRGSDFHAEIEPIPSTTETAGVVGQIHGSLFEGVVA
ncbi:MAG: hypothetical protein WB787_14055, partial [Candidatus Acidiferrales bacterium]